MQTKMGWAAAALGVVLGWLAWHITPAYLAQHEIFGTTITSVKVWALSPDKPVITIAVQRQTSGHYHVVLNIPPIIERGEYELSVHSVYTRSWFGLFDHTVSEEIERVPVEIR